MPVQRVEQRARRDRLHLGPRLHPPELADLHRRADHAADERIGKVRERARLFVEGKPGQHVAQLGAAAEGRGVTAGREDRGELGAARAHAQQVVLPRPVGRAPGRERLLFDPVRQVDDTEVAQPLDGGVGVLQPHQEGDVGAVEEEEVGRHQGQLGHLAGFEEPAAERFAEAEPPQVPALQVVVHRAGREQ